MLGLLVLVNVQLDARRPAARSRKAEALTLRGRALLGAKTFATFTTIALLWSLWSSPSLGSWLSLLGRGMRV